MSNMKCPFCNGELERVYSRPFQLICVKCGSLGTDELWQELIRTRKALDVAVDALKKLEEKAYLTEYAQGVVDKALKEITALEQKDK